MHPIIAQISTHTSLYSVKVFLQWIIEIVILWRVKIPCNNRSHSFFSTKKNNSNVTIIVQRQTCSYIEAVNKKLFNSITMFHNIIKCMFFCHKRSFFHFHLQILFDTIPILLKLVSWGNVITEFQNWKWRIKCGRSKIKKSFYSYKTKFPKVCRVVKSKFDNRISKFKMANSIWLIKSLKIVFF